jgi:hypothetical protein
VRDEILCIRRRVGLFGIQLHSLGHHSKLVLCRPRSLRCDNSKFFKLLFDLQQLFVISVDFFVGELDSSQQ